MGFLDVFKTANHLGRENAPAQGAVDEQRETEFVLEILLKREQPKAMCSLKQKGSYDFH